jgi:F-type H+-transporting ATPase subunit b
MRLRSSARWSIPFLLAVLGVVLTVAPALAAGDHGAGAEKKGGLVEMFDLKRYDLGIFTLLVFGLLCGVLYWFAWPKLVAGLAKREAVITAARDEAIKTRQEAEELRKKLQNEFAQAHDQIRALMDEARRDAEVLRAKEREAGQRDAAVERERARKEIEAAKDTALAEIHERAVQLAALMSSKAIRRQLSIDDQNRLIQESLAELKTGVGRG